MIRRRTLGIAFALTATLSVWCRADEFSDNFTDHLNDKSLDALAQDVGTAMGGGSFHSGKALGFPLGFDLGIHVPVVKVSDDNAIIKDDSSSMQALWGQLEVGLPAKINLIGRVGKMYDADLIGGGIRLGLISSSVPGVPSLSVTGLYSEFDHDSFTGNTISANVALSFDVPFVHPYIGAGYDRTTLEPTSRTFDAGPAGVSRSLKGEKDGYRLEGGINISIIPFTYITLGGGLANGESLYHAGAGVKF